MGGSSGRKAKTQYWLAAAGGWLCAQTPERFALALTGAARFEVFDGGLCVAAGDFAVCANCEGANKVAATRIRPVRVRRFRINNSLKRLPGIEWNIVER